MTQNITSWIMTLSLFFGAMTLKTAQRQRLRQWETLYVQRYWSLMDKLSLPALRGDPSTDVEEGDQRVARAYLRLCEDQLELREQGWITNTTWRVWSTGMELQLRRWPFNVVWAEVRDADTHEFTLLRRLEQTAGWDPCEMSRVRRYLVGVGGRRSI